MRQFHQAEGSNFISPETEEPGKQLVFLTLFRWAIVSFYFHQTAKEYYAPAASDGAVSIIHSGAPFFPPFFPGSHQQGYHTSDAFLMLFMTFVTVMSVWGQKTWVGDLLLRRFTPIFSTFVAFISPFQVCRRTSLFSGFCLITVTIVSTVLLNTCQQLFSNFSFVAQNSTWRCPFSTFICEIKVNKGPHEPLGALKLICWSISEEQYHCRCLLYAKGGVAECFSSGVVRQRGGCASWSNRKPAGASQRPISGSVCWIEAEIGLFMETGVSSKPGERLLGLWSGGFDQLSAAFTDGAPSVRHPWADVLVPNARVASTVPYPVCTWVLIFLFLTSAVIRYHRRLRMWNTCDRCSYQDNLIGGQNSDATHWSRLVTLWVMLIASKSS